MVEDLLRCEVCGEPATCGVRDIARSDNFETGWVDMKPYGPPHFYCKAHNRPSKEYNVTESPITWWFRKYGKGKE